MTDIISQCPQCCHRIIWHISQYSHPKMGLLWSRSVICPFCDYCIEEDAMGFPPQELRDELLCIDGWFGLQVNTTKEYLTVLKVLRTCLSLDMTEVAELHKKLPGIVWKGTKDEVMWLKQELAKSNVTANSKQIVKD